jgi:hypothetical protein
MTMNPGLRKFALATHLTFSTGWIGAVAMYLALGLAARTTDSPETLRAVWIGMDLTGWYVIVPLAVGSLTTGLLMALGTKWGLFRHYWVLFSLILTVLATVVLLLHMPDVSLLAEVARKGGEGAKLDVTGKHIYSRLDQGDLLHPGLGLVVLLLIQVLNVFKPRGLTRHGWRKEQEERLQGSRQTSGSSAQNGTHFEPTEYVS